MECYGHHSTLCSVGVKAKTYVCIPLAQFRYISRCCRDAIVAYHLYNSTDHLHGRNPFIGKQMISEALLPISQTYRDFVEVT